MKPIAVVTSFSQRGFDAYGSRFVETFRRHWPEGVALYVVSEDMERDGILDLRQHQPAAEFMARHAQNLRVHGRVERTGDVAWSPKKRTEGYNFRYDAFRFAKKVFAIEMVAKEHVSHGRLFWIDADVLTFADVAAEMLERMLPGDKALSCLDRAPYHSECGFVGYNLDHDFGPMFIAEFAKLYATDAFVELKEWHDSWVFDWLRQTMKVPTFSIPHYSKSHPFVNSELGRYMDHCKGSRKAIGRTPHAEVRTHHDVAYWRRAS
jgi:hypothetical protein